MPNQTPDHPLVTELLGRIDARLKTFPANTGRRVFLGGELEKAKSRYATACRCAARNQPDPNVPEGMTEPSAVDHLVVISEIEKRLAALMNTEAA